MNQRTTVLVSGATGMLGGKIASSLLEGGEAEVRALVRPAATTDEQKAKSLGELEARGLTVVEGDLSDPERSLRASCEGVDVIVSAINGERRVVVDGQKNLIEAAEAAGVRRMIPSDYSPDHFKLDLGDNHNLDMRKEVAEALEESNIAPTSVFNGVFADVLISPYNWQLDPKEGCFYYYGGGEQPYDFTTVEDTARYTVAAAIDPRMAGRALKVAGNVLSQEQLLATYNAATGSELVGKSLGTVEDLRDWIEEKKRSASSAWDYVFYQHHWAIVSGKGKLDRLDNDLYPDIQPTSVEQFVQGAVRQG